MKKLINILLIFAFGLYLAGCDSDDNEVLPFGITRSDLKFTASGGEGKVETSLAITRTASDCEWCSVAVKGNSVTVTVAPNTELTGRNAMVQLYSDGQMVSVPVNQSGILLYAETEQILAGIPAEVQKAEITSNIDWTVSLTGADGWANATRQGDTLVVEFSANPGRPRTATAHLTAGNVVYEVALVQQGVVPLNELFLTSTDSWYFNSAKMSPVVKQYFDMANTQINEGEGERIYQMTLTQQNGLFNFGFVTVNAAGSGYESLLEFTIVGEEGTQDQIGMTFNLKGNSNGSYYYGTYSGFQYLVSLLGIQPYRLTADDSVNPTELTFTGVTNSSFSFTLSKAKVLYP